MYVQPLFIFVNVLHKKKLRLKIYLLKGEKSSSAEMDIVFTELLLAGRMKLAMKNNRKSRGQVIVYLRKKPKVCKLSLFFSNSLEDLIRKSKISRAPAETEDMYLVVHRSLSGLSVPTHLRRRKG